MGKISRDRGCAFEREVVNLFKEHGLDADRVPLSGQTTFAKGDVVVRPSFSDEDWVGECKRRRELPSYIADALAEHDFLVMRADRQGAVAVIPLKTLAELLQ